MRIQPETVPALVLAVILAFAVGTTLALWGSAVICVALFLYEFSLSLSS